MTPVTRRIVYAISFEGIGILLSATVLVFLSGTNPFTAGGLSILCSVIALGWSVAFNSAFEAWEARQTRRGRPLSRRVAHTVLYEAGLTLILVPVVAWWLDVSLVEAFLYDFAIVLFFAVYAFAFNWAFDLLFGLPRSAR